MESLLGKIVLEKNKSIPIVVISEEQKYLRGLQLVKSTDECSHDDEYSQYKVSSEELIRIKYHGKKLDNVIADCGECLTIYNLQIREIGAFTEEAYFKLLRRYINYHCGDRSSSYQQIRNEVQMQLIKQFK